MALALCACDSSDGPVREWTPQDHRGEQRDTGQVKAGHESAEGATLAAVTWRDSCAPCHGLDGRGNTPQGQMLRILDLTRPELAKLDDAALTATIKNGRNKMPAFEKLPDGTVSALVRYVRALGQQPQQRREPE
jgi:cytochrome c6